MMLNRAAQRYSQEVGSLLAYLLMQSLKFFPKPKSNVWTWVCNSFYEKGNFAPQKGGKYKRQRQVLPPVTYLVLSNFSFLASRPCLDDHKHSCLEVKAGKKS